MALSVNWEDGPIGPGFFLLFAPFVAAEVPDPFVIEPSAVLGRIRTQKDRGRKREPDLRRKREVEILALLMLLQNEKER